MNNSVILFADGDKALCESVAERGKSQGMLVHTAMDGITALKIFQKNMLHLIVLNTHLPELDGTLICRQIRKSSDLPIILLSSYGSEKDRLEGFDCGANDFMIKPVYIRELFARINSFLSLCGCENPACMSVGGLSIDMISREVKVDEKQVQLTPKEFNLLLCLFLNPKKVMSRETLLSQVWGISYFGSDRTVDTHIKSLREHLKPYDNCIQTVWGVGYKFDMPGAAAQS